ncbi:MAG: GTP-binding protein, partial [Prevotella sp.]|nr:GTP-binding protein [Prevotella sp.]
MRVKEIPVLLLTGYLGSGKTTLVNRILANKKGIKFAVIVNDIGEINIDADLIEKGGIVGKRDESLVALQNGCICCTLKMDLVEQLRDITRLNKFDYIVIEASGICEPAPIAQTICSIPTMGLEYVKDGLARLDCIVTVVDALRMKSDFGGGNDLLKSNIDEEDIENLVIQQIEFCNIVLLNKASEVERGELARLHQVIRSLQPKAQIIECDYGDVDLEKILDTRMFDFNEVASSATWIAELDKHHDEDEHEDDDDDEHEHHHHHDDDDDDDEHEHHHHHDDDDDDDD